MAPVGLQINRGGEKEPNMWKTPNRLYLNKDRTAVVPEGPDAASLLSPAGQEITDADCRRYGLGPYAPAQDATTGDTGVEEAETTTDTETEPEGPQNGSQDDESEGGAIETEDVTWTDGYGPSPAADKKPRRKR